MTERHVRKLHEKQYEENIFYKERADIAIKNGLPFCPLEKGTVLSMSCKSFDCQLKGLCFSCFLKNIYHEVWFYSEEKMETNQVNRNFEKVCGKREHKKFIEDDGRNKKEQISRKKAKDEKMSLTTRPFLIGGPIYGLQR